MTTPIDWMMTAGAGAIGAPWSRTLPVQHPTFTAADNNEVSCYWVDASGAHARSLWRHKAGATTAQIRALIAAMIGLTDAQLLWYGQISRTVVTGWIDRPVPASDQEPYALARRRLLMRCQTAAAGTTDIILPGPVLSRLSPGAGGQPLLWLSDPAVIALQTAMANVCTDPAGNRVVRINYGAIT